ncbi:hypothetical protein SAY87_006630 [Trapa incisa]|uniref:Uncharacterized protein n=1 Tax=Trapa incisa TaxID=236973 RepID=A0AAN7K2Z5_9MYRT|nr:hypothetical protein SAY87_006630 [Trapa incisa]
MWRQKSFSVGVDSDQSISDDEEIDGDSSRSCFLSSSRANKKGGSQILSQLERLRDAGKTNSSMKCNLSMQKAAGFVPFSDKVELPSSRIDGSLLWPVKGSPKFFSDEEMISDDEDNNVFPKVSIISTTNKDCEEKRNWDSPVESHVEVPGHEHPERSMAEFLDDLSERLPTGLPTEYNQFGSKGKQRIQLAMKRSIEVVEDSEDESESLDSDSPGEEERNFQILKVPSPEKKRQIIVDHFQDLLDASPWRDKNALVSSFNSSSFGLFGRLQMVIQNEKHRELGFMNNLHKSETLPCKICFFLFISFLEGCLKLPPPEIAAFRNTDTTSLLDTRFLLLLEILVCLFTVEKFFLSTCYAHPCDFVLYFSWICFSHSLPQLEPAASMYLFCQATWKQS